MAGSLFGRRHWRGPSSPSEQPASAHTGPFDPALPADAARPGLAPVIPLHPSAAAPGPDAVDKVYEREHLGLFRFIKGVVRDQDVAEDILQEAFVRLVREVRAGQSPGNVHAWLYRVASNLAISRGRRAQVMVRHLPELVSARHAASPEGRVLQAERDDAVRLALAALPTDARAALVLASSGFTAKEIGAVLGKSEGAVRMIVSRSRLRVRLLVAKADVEPTTEAS